MQLQKLFAYFKGYVILRVEGMFLEKFLNLALHRGINFFDAKTLGPEEMELTVLLSDFWELRHIARKVSCTLKIKSRQGFPFIWSNMKKRKMLLIGFIFFVFAMYLLSGFVWQVEVQSYEELQNITEDMIIDEVYELGLKPGSFKKSIDRHQLEKELVQNINLISWVAIDFQGTKAIVKVVERVVPSPEQLEKSPVHVVAKKDGIIEEFLVMVGEPKVKVGDTVSRGQVLISGLIQPQMTTDGEIQEGPLGEPRRVRARGIIRASVWYQLKWNIPLHQVKTIRTGNSEESIKLATGDKIYLIKGTKGCSFEDFKTENKKKEIKLGSFKTPFTIIKTIYHEVEIEEKRFTKEEALNVAAKKSLQSIKAELPFGAKILEHKVEIIEENETGLKVKVLIKSLEDIAKTIPF